MANIPWPVAHSHFFSVSFSCCDCRWWMQWSEARAAKRQWVRGLSQILDQGQNHWATDCSAQASSFNSHRPAVTHEELPVLSETASKITTLMWFEHRAQAAVPYNGTHKDRGRRVCCNLQDITWNWWFSPLWFTIISLCQFLANSLHVSCFCWLSEMRYCENFTRLLWEKHLLTTTCKMSNGHCKNVCPTSLLAVAL